MEYILIENFNGVISIVTDENGEPLVFKITEGFQLNLTLMLRNSSVQ